MIETTGPPMASFATHLYGAAIVSSAAALGLYATGLADTGEAQSYFVVGIVGGLLPDIDSDSSTPVRAFFSFVGAATAFLVCFLLIERFPVVELALIWSLVYLTVRFGVLELFARLTVHRGLWHSWLAALFVSLATANIAYWAAGCPSWTAWVYAGFMGLGYLTHLCLDELASVDLLNSRVRRSLGSAMKPFSASAPWASLMMAGGVLLLALLAPSLAAVGERVRGLDYPRERLEARLWQPSPWLAALQTWTRQQLAAPGG